VHSFTHDEVTPLVDWINERHAIYMRKAVLQDQKERGLDKPHLSVAGLAAWGKGGWTLGRLTDDPILGQYRFCNVFRELDRVTVWIRENIREPFADHEHLWFMLAAARFINWPGTLSHLMESVYPWPGTNSDFKPEDMTRALEWWKAQGHKVETGAYMIRAESDPKKDWYSWSKQKYVAEIVLGRPWRDRSRVASWLEAGNSLRTSWDFLVNLNPDWVGWGPFMAGQIVADLRHTRYLRDAPDVGLWAPLGPGSMRGLNRLAGRPLKQTVGQTQGLNEMLALRHYANERTASWVPEIELHDLQNCLCETDKYLRVKTGEGRPRAMYVAGRGW
jgi:hypothetical protein